MLTRQPINLVVTLLVLAALACNPLATFQPTATPTPAPTLTPSLTPTATATPAPTDTPTPTPVPTSTPRPTATATPVPQPGDTLLADTFDENIHDWGVFTRTGVTVKVSSGALAITVTDPQMFYFSNPAGRFADVDLTVETTLVEGLNRNSFSGAQCRKKDDSNFYMAAITANGYYALVKYANDKWKPLVDWTLSSAIKTGKATNSVRLICSGQVLQVWINGVRLVTLKDKEFASGQIGVLAGTFDAANPKTIVNFDNVSATLPEAITVATGGGAGGTPRATSGAAATQAPQPTASGTGQLIVVMCQGIEATVTIFHAGQIIQQYSLHNAGRNVYELPPGHYDVQFNAAGYLNLNLAYDIVAGQSITQYIGSSDC